MKNISRKKLYLQLNNYGCPHTKKERAKLLFTITGHDAKDIEKTWFAQNNTHILLTEDEFQSICKFFDCTLQDLNDPTDRYSFNFGFALTKILEEKGMTGIELAKKLNISVQTVYKWTQGKAHTDFPTMCALCEIFECDLDYFTGRLDDTHDIKTHKVKDISDVTGLSPQAVDKLLELKNNGQKYILNGLSLLLTDESNIIPLILYCIDSFRLKEDIKVDILPKGYDEASLWINHYEELEESLENRKKYEACDVASFKDLGIMALTYPNATITINENIELSADIIRQAKISKLTHALNDLADRVEDNPLLL